ncbi:hypothetical protein BSLG_005683 [Batrachochytrium salamandrivorans]|nr:hypothetical protein BSLG_005683 [Batrachochytrium salamandrivorans]
MADKAMADDPLGTVGYVWSAVLENKIYRMMMIIDKYQEMPQLLDPHLEEILTPIISRLLAGIKSFHTHPKAAQILQIQQWRPFFMIICHLAKARGRKIIMNYFTHEVADLEPCIAFLNFLKSDTDLSFDAPGKEHEGASILIMRILSRWRYQRGSRSLAENLAATSAGSSVEANQSKMRTEIPCTLKPLDEDDFDEVPDEMEDIINILLDGLRDKDTIVRWTSAKGVGRITNRLNHELADEIVGSVIDSLAEDTILVNGSPRTAKVDSVSDSSWHGASLALAELIRRGLLLLERLKSVFHGLCVD